MCTKTRGDTINLRWFKVVWVTLGYKARGKKTGWQTNWVEVPLVPTWVTAVSLWHHAGACPQPPELTLARAVVWTSSVQDRGKNPPGSKCSSLLLTLCMKAHGQGYVRRRRPDAVMQVEWLTFLEVVIPHEEPPENGCQETETHAQGSLPHRSVNLH